jgi:hypothetical protein
MHGLYDLVPASRPIDYDRMNREYPKVKAALTRAVNSGYETKVLEAVERFLALSDEVGCMPDDWPRWRNALEDAWRSIERQLDEFGDDLYDAAGEASPVLRFQRAAVRF